MKRYLTTAIPYLNGAPHIGHALDYLNADVARRFFKMRGDEVRLQAGTDEHGNKVAKKAREAGKSEQEFTDENARKFREFIKKLGVEYTDFVRTTDTGHIRRCREIWQRLRPFLYKNTYHGWYCEGCEQFVTEKEVDKNDGVCPDHETAYLELDEENYYLRIADFKPRIREAILTKKMRILPEFREREMLALLKDAPDVSVSRPKAHLQWGVPVPGDPEQVMYVWIDALANYLTVLGYPEKFRPSGTTASGDGSPNVDDRTLGGWWPADVQFMGKDILRFHTIIWPAMLLALGLELPKTVHSHGFVQVNSQKISKSLGNTIDPNKIIDKFGLDAFRYYFLRHVDTFADTDFTWEKFDSAYNDELANDYGNLVQRLATLAQRNEIALTKQERAEIAGPAQGNAVAETASPKNADVGTTSPKTFKNPRGDTAENSVLAFSPEYAGWMEKLYFSKALDVAWGQLQQLNRDINEVAPWSLAKNGETEQLQQVMKKLILQLLCANHLLKPFLPGTAERVEQIFTADVIVAPKTPLFPKK